MGEIIDFVVLSRNHRTHKKISFNLCTFFVPADGAMTTESNGHTQQNGDAPTVNKNGLAIVPKNENLNLDKTDMDIVRLIGQHLKVIGLE